MALEITNKIKLSGAIVAFDKPFYFQKRLFQPCLIEYTRKSSVADRIPVVVPVKLLKEQSFVEGDMIEVSGQLRSLNSTDSLTGKRQLNVYVFAKAFDEQKFINDNFCNDVELSGIIVNSPLLRKTGNNFTLASFLLAHNSKYCKSYYIPCLAWDNVAQNLSRFKMAQSLKIKGRLQARTFQTKDNTCKDVLELSVYSCSVV